MKTISIRLTDDEYLALETAARADRAPSLSAWIRDRLARAVNMPLVSSERRKERFGRPRRRKSTLY